MDSINELRHLAEFNFDALTSTERTFLYGVADELERLQARIAKLEERLEGKVELEPSTSEGGIRA